MNEWKKCKLGDVLTLQRGHDLSYKQIEAGNIPVIGSNGIIGYHNLATTKAPCVTIGRSGNIGKAYYYNFDCWAHNTVLYVKDFKNTDPKYAYYLLKNMSFSQYNAGSAVPTLNRNHIHPIEISLPPLPTQQKIAAILSSLDDKIELNNQMNKTLEEIARALFHRWFVEFEFPDENGKPYKSSGGRMVESELGWVPEGWDIISFKDFLITRNEKSNDPFIPEYSVTNIGIHLRDEKFKKKLSSPQSKNKIIHKYDLVFGMSREILNWGLMKDEIGGVSSAYHVFDVDVMINPLYLESFMKTHILYFKDVIRPASREGQGIDKGALFSKLIYHPPKELLDKYYSMENRFLSMSTQLEDETEQLIQMRDTLLPKLMSGDLSFLNLVVSDKVC